MSMGYQTMPSGGRCLLASVTRVMFAQGQNLGERSTADRDYVYARKDIRKATSKYIDFKGYFLKIWTLCVRSPDILKHHFKNNELHALTGHTVSEFRTKSSTEV